MIVSDDLKVTTEVLWRGAVCFAIIDLVYVFVLSRIIKPDELIRMKWRLVIVMCLFFFILFGSIVSIIFWDSVYSYVFPSWFRWIIPPLYGILFSSAGLLFWWISTKFKSARVVIFCLFGGVWGVITHILAIQRGILEKPPMLNGAGALSALTIAAFEFVFYWCVCLTISRISLAFKTKKTTN